MFRPDKQQDDMEWQAEFESSYDTAIRYVNLLSRQTTESESLLVPAHLLRVSLLHNSLTDKSDVLASSIDVQKPALSEVMMLRAPVSQLLSHLKALLQEWPENPLLEQLSAICRRLLGNLLSYTPFFDITAPKESKFAVRNLAR